MSDSNEKAPPSSLENGALESNAFDPKAESRIRRKTDWMIMPSVVLIYLFCFIDRANIGNARIAGLEADLNMTGLDYNATLSIFYISYIIFEIPSNIVCKLIGPGWFLPILTVCFGVCSIATAWVDTVPQAMGVRFLLGLFESGMNPGMAYYLSRWYRRSELTFRISLYIVSAPLSGAFGGLLASAILRLDHFGTLKTWRMIFAIEGIITVALGLIGFITLTDRPATAWWLSNDEKELAEARIRSERLEQPKVLDRMDKKKLLRGITNPVVLGNAFMFLCTNITAQGLAFFTPTIVRTIYGDRTTVQQQLYTVPPYVMGSFLTVLFALLSWRMDQRQIFSTLSTPLVIVGYIMFLASGNATVRYAAIFLVASSIYSLGTLTMSQASANVVSDTARSSAIGINAMFGNIGGLISTWSFLTWDGPDYPIGNGLNLATTISILIVSAATHLWMKRDNAARDRKEAEALAAMDASPDVEEDLDWKHPSFRWQL
ncbi:major facilitator superfamily transporter [Dactylonectria macrodidyma]|uniref:Major facilitator superfamily transporter n=1 Tax=Dactylonectria macrodidyma TaxID=307937 RepID=A0A9P9JM52_9HYPO|nr:major facilitator superfamily transporter [Dactylonectria macrodidyma]